MAAWMAMSAEVWPRWMIGSMCGPPGKGNPYGLGGNPGAGAAGVNRDYAAWDCGSSLLPTTVRLMPTWTVTASPPMVTRTLPPAYQPTEPVLNSFTSASIFWPLTVTDMGSAWARNDSRVIMVLSWKVLVGTKEVRQRLSHKSRVCQ